ncbi:MAG TPA: M20/M25/M40 family metallo-hydrolase [Candidatus Dormibacteraeota bacterium]
MDDLQKLICELVEIESVNPDLVPSGSGETQIAAFVADWLERAGLEVEIVEASKPGRPSVVGTKRGTGGGKSLMLNAHMDTVGAGGMKDAFTPVVKDGRVYGRGATDMKASLAAIMLTARDAPKLKGDLIITAVADEEVASLGTMAVLEKYRADFCIVTEPTQLKLCLAHKGFVWLEVETTGVAAHGSRADIGVDAIALMGPVLTRVLDLANTLKTGPRHPLLGTGSIHASLIEGGQELSTYPSKCTVKIERRTIPGEDWSNELEGA